MTDMAQLPLITNRVHVESFTPQQCELMTLWVIPLRQLQLVHVCLHNNNSL